MRSLDHFAHAVRDLTHAGLAFERLGFHVLPVARHVEIGSCNRVFQLGHTYYEIVADLDRSLPLLRDRMLPRFQCGDGMAIVSLTSDDLPADRMAIAAQGLIPDPILNARRTVPMPDGGSDETNSHCFYVWREDRYRYLTLFLSHHYKPATIFVPAWQRHPNGATDVVGLTYVADDPGAQVDYFATMFGARPTTATPDRVLFVTPRGERLEILDPAGLERRYGAAAPAWCGLLGGYGIGIEFAVEDLGRCRQVLISNGVPFEDHEGRLRVPAAAAAGMVVEFRAR
ncbi:MAG: VOC family protein [Gemmatimonadales bacterium]|nr:VOC family protein [Gemmatimonadales bacterium]